MKVDLRPVLPAPADQLPAVQRVAPATLKQGTQFEALISQRERRVRRSLRADIEQAEQTAPVSAELFGTTRSLQVLTYLLETVLPGLDAEPEIRELAEDFIREEIDMRLLLQQQRAEVQA
jgi:hypothetical protein